MKEQKKVLLNGKEVASGEETVPSERRRRGFMIVLIIAVVVLLISGIILLYLAGTVFPRKTLDLGVEIVEQIDAKGIGSVTEAQISQLQQYRKWSIFNKSYQLTIDRCIVLLTNGIERWREIEKERATEDAQGEPTGLYKPVFVGITDDVVLVDVNADVDNLRSTNFPSYSEYERYARYAKLYISIPTPVQPLATDAATGRPISSEPAGEWAGPTD